MDPKFLIINKNVVLNDYLRNGITKLDKFFEAANHIAYVTSGIRTAEKQLQTIREYLDRKKIPDEFIDTAKVDSRITYGGEEIYSWQLGWSKLLNAGVIINPPLRAKLLLDYFNSAGVNRKGGFFEPSIHLFGKAIDIGGGANSVSDELEIVKTAVKSGVLLEIKSYVVERENNCLHLNFV